MLLCMVAMLTVGFCVAFGEQETLAHYASLSTNKKSIFEKSGTVINHGNKDQGYVMIKQSAGKKRYKLKVTQGKNSLNYDINQEGIYEIIPLQLGNGKYKFQMYKQKKGTEYTPVSSKTIEVKLENKNIVYLYPNQYVNYDENTKAIELSNEICQDLATDEEKIAAIYEWVSTNIQYDYPLAMTVKTGYLPDIDQVLESKMAICFGYSALMACMLRVQGIPAQLVIGHADKTYHAWNKILIEDEWVRYDATFKHTGGKVKKYTEERKY